MDKRIEEWRDIIDFPGYQISNLGRVRSFLKSKLGKNTQFGTTINVPHIMNTKSDDGNGYKKVMLRRNNKSFCRKIHRLVAETFVYNSDPTINDTVDHISNDKSDNSSDNLMWISRAENIQKAYSDGLCDERIRKSRVPIWIENIFTGEELFFDNMVDAAGYLNIHYTTLSHALKGKGSDYFHGDYVVRKLRDERWER